MRRKISLVIFDMDGLMFDTERIMVRAWESAGRECGYNIKKDLAVETVGMNIAGTKAVFERELGRDFPFHDVRDVRQTYVRRELEKKGMPVKPGLPELLDYLSTRPLRTAVATSTERGRAEGYLEAAGVLSRFDTVVYGDEIEKSKPEPDIFLEAARRTGCLPSECLVLEDSESGLKAAAGAGMLSVFIQDIKRPSGDVLKSIYREAGSLHEVPVIIEQLLE